MDQAFARFRDALNAEILAAQVTDRVEIEGLCAQIKALEQRAVTAESEREMYKADLAAAEEKARIAEEKTRKANQDASKRKADCDALKKTLDDALAKLV